MCDLSGEKKKGPDPEIRAFFILCARGDLN